MQESKRSNPHAQAQASEYAREAECRAWSVQACGAAGLLGVNGYDNGILSKAWRTRVGERECRLESDIRMKKRTWCHVPSNIYGPSLGFLARKRNIVYNVPQ